jgi:hypothetical protein
VGRLSHRDRLTMAVLAGAGAAAAVGFAGRGSDWWLVAGVALALVGAAAVAPTCPYLPRLEPRDDGAVDAPVRSWTVWPDQFRWHWRARARDWAQVLLYVAGLVLVAAIVRLMLG